MAVLYRPDKCDQCRRNHSGFCVRERFHRITYRVNQVNGIIIEGPYPADCKRFSKREVNE